MITKERLEELIKQEATIYAYMPNFNIIEHKLDYYDFYRDRKTISYNLLYETKEEAEFVAKNHDTRIEKFEPPFELGKLGYEFNSKKWGTVEIEKDDIDNYYTVREFEGFEYFDTYQEAVDYARKLFKGEE